jgi:histidine kinase
MGAPGSALRSQFAAAVDQALLVGALVGAVAATAAGAVAAYRLVRPIRGLQGAARRLAGGAYAAPVPVPHDRELAALATDLQSLGQSLAETETRRVRLLGEVAHEMRTPLTVIDAHVEGMIDGVLPTTAQQLGVLGDEVRRLRRLADDLSALSRADEGRLTLVPADVDLAQVVGPAAQRLRAQVEDAGLALQVDLGPEAAGQPGQPAGLPVHADPDRIAQIVTNLIGNAVRATPAGGMITVRCRRTGPLALAEVTDTGEGLAPAELERVFERFYRVPGRRSPSADSGSGIGLTIARAIARAHGGDLVARSAGHGAGATFALTIPLRPGPTPTVRLTR